MYSLGLCILSASHTIDAGVEAAWPDSLKRRRAAGHQLSEDAILKGWPEQRGRVVEEKLKTLMQELGNAINESLSDSDRIAAAIGDIRRAGYDVFLVLEATIGFNKRDENEAEGETEEATAEVELDSPGERSPVRETRARIKWTSQDQKFLRALKIAVDDEAR